MPQAVLLVNTAFAHARGSSIGLLLNVWFTNAGGSWTPATATTNTAPCSRGANAPELCKISSAFPEKGRGECRALDAPAVSRAKWGREHTRSSPWVHRGHPAFPHAMVLTVSSVISPVIGFVVTVALLAQN